MTETNFSLKLNTSKELHTSYTVVKNKTCFANANAKVNVKAHRCANGALAFSLRAIFLQILNFTTQTPC